MDDLVADWFTREILPHEAALVRFLRRVWPIADDIHDLRQEVYTHILEAAATSRPHSPKSFLFATTRHLLSDRARRSRIVSIDLMGDLDTLNVLVDEISPERQMGARQQLAQLSDAFNALSDKAREVIWMRKVEDLPQKVIARRLQMTRGAVEKQTSRGMRALADSLFGREVREARDLAHTGQKEEQRHGE
jgi:RNA polymerase sigma-70 factor (ECF subfamily)